jgi:hypothetical protein
VGSLLNNIPDHIQIFKPTIGSRLITDLSPDTFLEVQAGLIRRQVVQMQSYMGLYKKIDLLTFVPSRPIHIKPDRVPLKPPIKMLQTVNESLSIALGRSHQPLPTEQRGNPSEDIQPLMMLAGRRNPESLSCLGPSYPKTRMESKPGFVLKNNGFLRPQRLKFFLTPDQIVWPPRSVPEDKYNQPVLVDNPIDASRTEPAEPSRLSRNAASGEQPTWDHPTEFDLTQILTGTSLNRLPVLGEPLESNEQDALASLPVPKISTPDRLPCASRDSSSDASNPGPRRSIPDADPPLSATEPQFLFQHGLPEFAEPWLIDALGSLQDGLTLRLDFS